MKHFIVMTICWILSGCSAGIDVHIPEAVASNNQTPGYLAGSLGMTTTWPATGEDIITTLYIRPVGEDEPITLTNTKSRVDFETPASKGHIFVAELPAGKYEIYKVFFRGSNGRKTVHSASNGDLAIYFDVTEHNVSYIGQFLTSSLVAKSQLWNTPYPSGFGIIHHSYTTERDEKLITGRFPELEQYAFSETALDGYEAQKLASKVIK